MPRKWQPALDEVEETSGRVAGEAESWTTWYYSGKNLQETSGSEALEAYIATDRRREAGEGGPGRRASVYLVKADFRYDEER